MTWPASRLAGSSPGAAARPAVPSCAALLSGPRAAPPSPPRHLYILRGISNILLVQGSNARRLPGRTILIRTGPGGTQRTCATWPRCRHFRARSDLEFLSISGHEVFWLQPIGRRVTAPLPTAAEQWRRPAAARTARPARMSSRDGSSGTWKRERAERPSIATAGARPARRQERLAAPGVPVPRGRLLQDFQAAAAAGVRGDSRHTATFRPGRDLLAYLAVPIQSARPVRPARSLSCPAPAHRPAVM